MINIDKLARAGFLRSHKENEIICKEGEPGHEMYIILQGRVEITAGGLDLAVLHTGDFFGEMSLLEGIPRSATAKTTQDSLLLVLTEENFKEVIQAEPLLAFRIMKSLSQRIRHLNEELKKLKQATAGPASEKDLPALSNESSTGEKVTEKSRYLYNKSVTCPVCNFTFDTLAVMSSKLKLLREDPDLRRHFEGFEPLLYSVWFCPACYYASLPDNFLTLTTGQKKLLKECEQERKQKFGNFGEPGEITYAVKSYLLLLENYEQIKADPAQRAKIWLRLAWLYDDAKDEENATSARKKALELFEQFYFSSTKNITVEQEQQIAYLIGELNYNLGNLEEALSFFRRAAMHRGGNQQFNHQIQERIYELRALKKKDKN